MATTTKTSTAVTAKASPKTSKPTPGIREAGASERPASSGPKPVPKATRSLAAVFATLGDPRALQVLGNLSNGLPATSSGLAATLGMEAETASAAITSLKRQGWVEGSRVEGSRNYSYKITESGSAAWGKAQGFIIG